MMPAQYRETILALGQSAATSSDVVLMDGQTRTVALFRASGALPASLSFSVTMQTPGADITIDTLTTSTPALVIAGPGTFRVSRPDISGGGVNIGVVVEGR